ncbi:MAG: UDP-3-O-(3-hydroxymyristoyl)glucosamine N-acyltransferase [Candidatus Stahlbacteria bacterium]|nr:UDP-3-O-(3-hydroxymyristoyl)glucosamine N-acyltransferase [Candidatus Stahlbacteria bacterium]
MKLGEIAKLIGGKLNGDADILISHIASIEDAKEGAITWASHPRYKKWLNSTSASCVIVSENSIPFTKNGRPATIRVENPDLAVYKLLRVFYPESLPCKEISPQAHISESAKMGKEVSIGAFVFIGEQTVIGDNVIIYPNVYIGNEVKIDNGTHIYPNVTILDKTIIGRNVRIYSGAVIGTDGFAYTHSKGKHTHIPHCGGVIIEEYVEIGALSTIARSVVGNTIIKKGTKIDNLVHIAHNVVIDEHSIITAQVGVAGSVKMGKNVVIGGQAGIGDHIVIGDNVTIGGQSGVTKDVKQGITVCGYPAAPRRQSNLAYSLLMKLPELFKRVSEIEKNCFNNK